MPAGKTALYRFYAADGELLYVGMTQDVETRWKRHERDKIWWKDVARKESTWFSLRSDACDAEREAIRKERPRYDRTRPGHRTPAGELIYKVPLDDPYQEEIVLAAERLIRADIRSGVIPSWSVLPANATLAARYETSTAAVDHALCRLTEELVMAPSRRYVCAPPEGFPSASARANGELYVVAAHHFQDRPFTLADLACYVPYALTTISQLLAELCRKSLVRRVAQKSTGRYVITAMPEPDPVVLAPATHEDVNAMEEWLVRQVEEDVRVSSDPKELLRLQRDRAVIAACTIRSYGYFDRRNAEALAEMAHFYLDRPGYQAIWLPERLGGPSKPTR